MAVVDSSALIPLLKIGEIGLLEKCFSGRVIIPKIVWKEVVEEGKVLGKNVALLEEKKHDFKIIELSESEILKIAGLEKNDAEVFSVAIKEKDILITNDASIHLAARAHGLVAWWLPTLVLYSVKQKMASKEEGKDMILELVASGMYIKPQVLSRILLILEKL